MRGESEQVVPRGGIVVEARSHTQDCNDLEL